MRSTTLGLSLALITGASALTLAPSTAAAPAANSRTSGEASRPTPTTCCPTPRPRSRAALREQAIADVLSGEATPQTDQRQHRPQGRRRRAGGSPARVARRRSDPAPVRRARATSAPTRSSSSSSTSATSATRATPTRTPTPTHRARSASTARSPTRSPSPDRRRQLHGLATRLQQGVLREPLLRYGHRRRVLPDLLREAVLGSLQRRRRGHRLVKVRYNEARYGRSNGYPCAGNVCSNTWDAGPRRHDPVGRRPEGRRAAPTSRSRPTSRRSTS